MADDEALIERLAYAFLAVQRHGRVYRPDGVRFDDISSTRTARADMRVLLDEIERTHDIVPKIPHESKVS